MSSNAVKCLFMTYWPSIHLQLLWHHLTIFAYFIFTLLNNDKQCLPLVLDHLASTPSFQIAILHFVKLRNNKSYCFWEATCNSISRTQSATLIGRTYHCKGGTTIHAPNTEFIGQFICLFLSCKRLCYACGCWASSLKQSKIKHTYAHTHVRLQFSWDCHSAKPHYLIRKVSA